MPDTEPRSPLHRLWNTRSTALAAVALLAVGGGAGAVAMQAARPPVAMAPVAPVAIRSLSSSGLVTIKGRVTEIYGNKFVMADASGSALVDTGRGGEGGRLVSAGQPVLVQGRFERGFVHAAFLVGPDNKVTALGPLEGPHEAPGRHGPRHGPDAPPPPPQSVAEQSGDAPPPVAATAAAAGAGAVTPPAPANTGR